MPEGVVDPILFAAGALLVAAAVRWWRPELPKRWIAGHALLVLAFFAVPLLTSQAQAPVDIAYGLRPWSEMVDGKETADNPLLTDIPFQMLPFRTLVRERLLALEAPLWAHELGTGQPLLGNAQSAPFAPLHLMALPVPPLRGLTLAAAWQMLLGLLLMHALVLALARGPAAAGPPGPIGPVGPVGSAVRAASWQVQAGAATGAAAFALSTYAVAWLYHPLSMVAMWIPGVVLGIVALHRGERRAFPGLVVAGAALTVSGHPETTAHGALLALGLGLVLLLRGPGVGRLRFAGRAAQAAALVACLCAPALLPVVQVLPESNRATLLRSGRGAGIHPRPFRPAALLPLVDPLAFGSPRDRDWSAPSNFNEYCSEYAGAAALAVAAAAVLVLGSWRLAAVVLSGLVTLLAAFKVPPVFQAVEALPLLGDAANGRLRLFWVLAVAVVVGVAAPRLARARRGPAAGSAALAAVALVAAVFPPPFGSLHQRLWWGVVLAGLALAGASLALPRLRAAFPAVLLAVTVADLFVLGVHFHALVPPSRQLEAPPALAWLVERSDEAEAAHAPFRVAGEGTAMAPNLPAIYGLWSPLASDPMQPHAARRIVRGRFGAGHRGRGSRGGLTVPFDLPALRMLGVRYVLTPHRSMLPEPWEPAVNEPGGRIWRLPETLGLFFVPERVRAVARPELEWTITMRNRDFQRLAVVFDPEAPGEPRRGVAQEGEVWLRRVHPNGFELVARSERGALVASSVSRVSGWRAEIDGEPAEPVTVNAAFLGVRVPPGVHGVELTYSPSGWRWGWWLCGGAVAALMLAWALRLNRRGAARRSAGSGAP